MVAVSEAGGKETVFIPRKATIIKKKRNKIFVPACLFIAAKIRRIDGRDHLKNKFNIVESTTCRVEDFCSITSTIKKLIRLQSNANKKVPS